MKNGTILLWKYKKSKGLIDFVSRLIVFFTNFPYVHVSIFLDGKTYEYTVWKDGKKTKTGIRITNGLREADEYREPTFDLSAHEVFTMIKYAEWLKPHKYSVLKLLVLSVIYPARWLFKKIKWVPFDNFIFGDVCSVLPAEMYEFIGRDIFPYDPAGITVPGMWAETQYFETKTRD